MFLRIEGRAVILIGAGESAAAKRRLLERAGARIVDESDGDARLAIIACENEGEARAAAERLRTRALVNVADRPELCDFTLPAIVDRDPVLIAIGTGGASAGLAAALRQRIEALLPAKLGALALGLHAARDAVRARWPDASGRRRAIAAALAPGSVLDPFERDETAIARWLEASGESDSARLVAIRLRSPDPDELTIREARLLASADRIHHGPTVPPALLDRARADAVRIAGPPAGEPNGLWIDLDFA